MTPFKKGLSFLLALVMLLSLLPVCAGADDLAETEDPAAVSEAADETPEAPAEEPAEPENAEPEAAEEPEAPAEETEEPAGLPEAPEAPSEETAEENTAVSPEEPTPDPAETLEALSAPDEEPPVNESVTASGTCGVGLEWEFTADTGALRIHYTGTGSAEMLNYSSSKRAPWYDLRDAITSAVIEPGVLSVGSYAFTGCDALRSVNLPRGLIFIGSNAFEGCSALTAVTIPMGASAIRPYAFKDCSALTSVTLPSSMTEIPDLAFYNCGKLTSITLPPCLTNIGMYAFRYCAGLASVVIPASVTYIDSCAFDSCTALTSITFLGSSPAGHSSCFRGVTANVLYPEGDSSWTEAERMSYGGSLNWIGTSFDTPKAITLSRDYLIMEISRYDWLTAAVTPETYAGRLVWKSEDTTVVTVNAGGKIQAVGIGTAYVAASVTADGRTVSARCRVDVTAAEPELKEQVSAVQLITTAATCSVYKTADYPRVSVLPVLAQNLAAASEDELPSGGMAITSAHFESDAVSGYFTLRVADDRTLEIIPTETAVSDALAGAAAFADSFTSRITVIIDGEAYTTDDPLKLTVKKTKPAAKAATVAFNSLLPEDELPLQLNNAAVSLTPVSVPEWITFTGSGFFLNENAPAKLPAKGTMKLSATLKGWREEITVPVSVPFTIKKTAPKLTFAAKSATLLQGSPDTVTVAYTVTPKKYANAECFPVELVKTEKLEGKKYIGIENDTDLHVAVAPGTLTLAAPNLSADGKAHTYKLTLSCHGKEFAYTVKTRAQSAAQFTAVSTGTISSRVENSPTTVTLKPKNYHAGIGEAYSLTAIEEYKGKTKLQDYADPEAVASLFTVVQNGSAFTFTEASPGALVSGHAYKALFAVDLDGDLTPDGACAAALKITYPKTAPAISLPAKKTGSFDIARRGNAVTLKPSLKNWYGDAGYSLEYYRKTGKKTELVDEAETPFASVFEGGVFTISLKDDCTAATGAYSVRISAALPGGKVYRSKTFALPVKQGKAALKCSTASGVLNRNDRNSRITFTLTCADSKVVPAGRLTLDAAGAKKFQVIRLDGSTWALEYLGNALPETFTASTVKLTVYLTGCEKPSGTVSIRVSYK